MTAIELLNLLTTHAAKYRVSAQESICTNSHMNDVPEVLDVHQAHIDAVLVDFINHIGAKMGVDFALYTRDIKHLTPNK